MQYIAVSESEESECIELPLEEDGTVLLSTVQGIFPRVCGLKYKSPGASASRALRLCEGRFYRPLEGWENIRSCTCVFPKDNSNKRKNEEDTAGDNNTKNTLNTAKRVLEEGSRRRQCSDLIVLNLGWNVDEDMLKKYFIKYGELVMVVVKRERESQQSRGYGFIRYSDYDSQLLCLADKHLIDGRWCPVKIPFSKNEADKQEISKKIHISYQSEDISSEDIRNTFEQYGVVSEIFVPKPFRNFAFVTFESCDVVQSLIGHTLVVKGHNVTIGSAVPKINNNIKTSMMSPQFNNNNNNNNGGGVYGEMAMNYGMMMMGGGGGQPWMYGGSYDNNNNNNREKVRGNYHHNHQQHYNQYGAYNSNSNVSYLMTNGQKSGQEAIQQGYANQDNLMQQYFGGGGGGSGGQFPSNYDQQQAIVASNTINILNNPEVVAAIVAAASKSAGSHAKYGGSQ